MNSQFIQGIRFDWDKIDNGSIHMCSYEETESYQVTEMFMNNRKALLNSLLLYILTIINAGLL